MKRLLLATLIATSALNSQAEEITFAMAPGYPPFEFISEKGDVIGFDVDLANVLCQELNVTCNFSHQSFDSLIPGIKLKKFDAIISAMDITEARAKQVAFTVPYYANSASFISVKNKTDLNSAKVVAVQNGTTFQQYITQQTKQYDTKSYAVLSQSILDLQNGRVDVIFGDTAVLTEWVKKDPMLQFVGEKVTDPKYFGNGFGIAVSKSNVELLEKLNKGLAKIKQNGEYQKIYDKWLSIK
ncbi:transporter substrate-binding domain-containing protein [Rodentibacter caecimuris]|uniref:Arginine ABC transporter substrate-binding protein n=1 Tax=Rodentibacter caecimuris TaxID=1796644 RepID=A0ABX3KYX3_9PAST|nr:arginine ABC transporter substrate-binding protein [Rodentibacter heylii]